MLSVGDVAVEFSMTLGKSTKAWLITKVCLDAFTRHIAYIMLAPIIYPLIYQLLFV
jgi:hypothetical protein